MVGKELVLDVDVALGALDCVYKRVVHLQELTAARRCPGQPLPGAVQFGLVAAAQDLHAGLQGRAGRRSGSERRNGSERRGLVIDETRKPSLRVLDPEA